MDVLKGGRRLLLGMGLVAAIPLHGATGRSSEVAVKDRANANASLAVSGQFAALVWSASAKDATDIYVATSRDGGRAFGAPDVDGAVAWPRGHRAHGSGRRVFDDA